MLYSHNEKYPEILPERIHLSDGRVRTDSSSFTNEELADAGYVAVEDSPEYNPLTHKLSWDGTNWQIIELTTIEVNEKKRLQWLEIRKERDNKISNIEWKIMRNLSETRLGITTTTDLLSDLDSYVNNLRNITTQSDPYNITWPTYVDSRIPDSTDTTTS
tara:strand:+ start:117 stop:596 length:480 start_codon:yes stop_codon:yes gene_type:complete